MLTEPRCKTGIVRQDEANVVKLAGKPANVAVRSGTRGKMRVNQVQQRPESLNSSH
jgi:hypothetical protein